MATQHTVYGLRIKGEREVRYVGVTYAAPDYRLRQHASQAERHRSGSPFGQWLRSNAGSVEAFRIAAADNREVAKATERLTIALCESLGQRLFNRQCMTDKSA